jgi:hypothetical protein
MELRRLLRLDERGLASAAGDKHTSLLVKLKAMPARNMMKPTINIFEI